VYRTPSSFLTNDLALGAASAGTDLVVAVVVDKAARREVVVRQTEEERESLESSIVVSHFVMADVNI
jgi:hypothetical protein